MFGQGALSEGVELARARVLLDLGVPLGFGTLVHPGADSGHLLGWQSGDGLLILTEAAAGDDCGLLLG